jgi:uncharacterized repeat protein (TIGR01451 family)
VAATPDPALPGQTVAYTITVTNIGGAASGSFNVYFPIPAYTAATLGSAVPALSSSTCSNSGQLGCTAGQVLTWTQTTLAAGANATFQVPVVVNSAGAPVQGTQVPDVVTLDDGVNGATSADLGIAIGTAGAFSGVGGSGNGSNNSNNSADAPLPLWSLFALGFALLLLAGRHATPAQTTNLRLRLPKK